MRALRSSALPLLFAFAVIFPAAAQTPEPTDRVRIDYGVRFGPSFTTLSSVETFDVTAAPAAFEPTLNFGGFVAIHVRGSLAIQPELLFAAKGHRIRHKDAKPVTQPTGEQKLPPADRVILVRYLEVPLLLRLSKRTHESTSLYVVAGPALAFRRNAVIRQVADPGQREHIDDLVSGRDLTYIAGGGLQHERWMVDARFTRGIKNIATDPTPEAVKTGAFSVLMGVRF